MMVPEMEKPGVTEIKVRMDCNGCVQKIKKALHGITGINDIYIDFSQQKITIIGPADPEKIVKAIKKTRKSAVICLHTQEPRPDQPPEPPEPKPEEPAPPPDPTSQPPEPTTQPQPSPPEQLKEPPPLKNPPPPDQNPSPEIANVTPSQPEKPHKPNGHEQIHVIHHHQSDYGYRYAYGPNFQQGHNGPYNSYHGGPQFGGGPSQPSQPVYATHSYNTYKPSPYVTEYTYPQSPPTYSRYSGPDGGYTRYGVPRYDAYYNMPEYNTRYSVPRYDTRYSMPDYNTRYSVPDYYSRDSSSGNDGNDNGSITSMLSEENPNACRIV